jgi:hypothetical protein
VQPGSTLQGNGTVESSITNDGTVAPQGSLIVAGNYPQTGGGALTEQFGSTLNVKSNGTLSGALNVTVNLKHPPTCRVGQTAWLALSSLCSKSWNWRWQLPASETVHSGRIVRWKRQRRRCHASHRPSDAFQHESNIGDIASHCRSRPAVASDSLEDLFAFQSIRSLYMTDRLHGVRSSS